MRAVLFSAALSAALLAPFGARAQESTVFDRWLDQNAPTCVPVSDLKAVSRVTDLTPAQFQFVRALYVALPPVSKTLPPGDRAIMATAGDSVMLGLVDNGQTCARFLAPDFIQAMLIKVGEGQITHIGTPVSWRSQYY